MHQDNNFSLYHYHLANFLRLRDFLFNFSSFVLLFILPLIFFFLNIDLESQKFVSARNIANYGLLIIISLDLLFTLSYQARKDMLFLKPKSYSYKVLNLLYFFPVTGFIIMAFFLLEGGILRQWWPYGYFFGIFGVFYAPYTENRRLLWLLGFFLLGSLILSAINAPSFFCFLHQVLIWVCFKMFGKKAHDNSVLKRTRKISGL